MESSLYPAEIDDNTPDFLPSIMTIWVPFVEYLPQDIESIEVLERCSSYRCRLGYFLPVPTVYWLSRLSRGYKGKHVFSFSSNYFPLSLSRETIPDVER